MDMCRPGTVKLDLCHGRADRNSQKCDVPVYPLKTACATGFMRPRYSRSSTSSESGPAVVTQGPVTVTVIAADDVEIVMDATERSLDS